MDSQEDSASAVLPGLLVSLVISSQRRFQAFRTKRGRPRTEAKVVSQLAPGRQLFIQAYYNFIEPVVPLIHPHTMLQL